MTVEVASTPGESTSQPRQILQATGSATESELDRGLVLTAERAFTRSEEHSNSDELRKEFLLVLRERSRPVRRET